MKHLVLLCSSLFSRVDCSGRRVASLDVDGVIKVNRHPFLLGLCEGKMGKHTLSFLTSAASGVVIQPYHAD